MLKGKNENENLERDKGSLVHIHRIRSCCFHPAEPLHPTGQNRGPGRASAPHSTLEHFDHCLDPLLVPETCSSGMVDGAFGLRVVLHC